MQPIKRAAGRVVAWRRGNGVAGLATEMEVVDVIAGEPLPQEFAVGRDFDEPIILKRGVGCDARLNVILVGE